MIEVDEAVQIVLNEAYTLGTIEIDTEDASGYVLSEAITSKEAMPPFRASIMDGYAVFSEVRTFTFRFISKF